MHFFSIKKIKNPIAVAFLKVDCDVNAERLQVFSRKTGELFSHKKIKNNMFLVFLPFKYSLENSLMCVMLDDNAEFNAAILDNIKPMPIDLMSFDPNNPQRYEPIP